MNYQMIFSNQAFLLAGKKYLAVFRNLYSVTGGFVTGSCCPAKWTWEKSEAADENRISASNGHSSCFCGNFMESTL